MVPRYSFTRLPSERERIRQRIRNFSRARPGMVDRALELLEPRLLRWDGEDSPSLSRRIKNKVPADIETTALEVQVEPAELMIAYALAWTDGTAQFGVTPSGVAFTADGNGWTISERTYLAGLSPLLDDAADIFNHLRGGRGGRFFLADGVFFAAATRRTFMQVRTVGSTAHQRPPRLTGLTERLGGRNQRASCTTRATRQ